MKALSTMLLAQGRSVMLLLCAVFFATDAWGGSKDYFFKIKAVASPTGAGKVYASSKNSVSDDNYAESSSTAGWSESNSQSAASTTGYLFAKPNEGYTFVNWTNSKGTVVGSAKNISLNLSSSTTSEPTEPQETYTANFLKSGLVSVSSNDDLLGSASIDKVTNEEGNTVTLTAKGYFYAHFTGWKKNGEGELITTNPLTLSVTEKANYVACFEDACAKGAYYMVYCKNGSGNILAYLGLNGKSEPNLNSDNRAFTNCLINLSTSTTTPTTCNFAPPLILKIKGTVSDVGLKNVSIEGQGVNSSNFISSGTLNIKKYDEAFYIEGEYSGLTGYLTSSGGYGYSTTDVTYGNVGAPSVYNHVFPKNDDYNFFWYFNPLTEETMDDYYFGAEPDETMTMDGKYYTSLYTSFPYKCHDGVKAYYVGGWTTDGNAVMKEITSGEVPSNTGVILECNGTTAKENRLVPMLTEPTAISDNLLKGCIQLNGEDQTAYYDASMRVFGMNSKSVIGFYKSSVGDGGDLVSNRAYLDISTRPSTLKSSVAMDFSNSDDVSGVTNVAPQQKRVTPQGWYDLCGRRLTEKPTKAGIYILNGKKIVIR